LRIRRIAAQKNIHAAARHIRGNRHRAEASRLGDNLAFTFMILGIQYFMPDPFPFQQFA